jgi:hypothetical protein
VDVETRSDLDREEWLGANYLASRRSNTQAQQAAKIITSNVNMQSERDFSFRWVNGVKSTDRVEMMVLHIWKIMPNLLDHMPYMHDFDR